MDNKNKSILGVGAILLATLFWGMTFAFIKDAVATLSPFNFLFWRFGIASFLLLLIFWQKIRFDRQTLFYGTLLGLLLAGTVIFQTIGLRYTTASTASFITGLSVIVVALFESFLNKQWPSLYVITATCHRPRLMLHPPATRSDPLRVNFFILFVTLLVKFLY